MEVDVSHVLRRKPGLIHRCPHRRFRASSLRIWRCRVVGVARLANSGEPYPHASLRLDHVLALQREQRHALSKVYAVAVRRERTALALRKRAKGVEPVHREAATPVHSAHDRGVRHASLEQTTCRRESLRARAARRRHRERRPLHAQSLLQEVCLRAKLDHGEVHLGWLRADIQPAVNMPLRLVNARVRRAKHDGDARGVVAAQETVKLRTELFDRMQEQAV